MRSRDLQPPPSNSSNFTGAPSRIRTVSRSDTIGTAFADTFAPPRDGPHIAAITAPLVISSGPERSLRQPETFHVLFESSPDAFVLIDSAGTIAAANPPTELLLGHAPRALAGSPAAPILPSLDLAARHLEVDARHRDGSIVPVEVSLTSFTSEGERWVLARLSRRSP